MLGMAAMLPLHSFAAPYRRSNFTEIRRGVGMYTERGGTIGWLMND